MYIYHFAPYEPSAVKRLATRFGTRETEVNQLLRGERFIDLHSIIKESLRASVERYPLKELEKFTAYQRTVELPLASAARRRLESALELGVLPSLPEQDLKTVEDYNKDDCLATEAAS